MKSIVKHIFLAFALCSVQFSIAQTPTWKNITPAGWSGTFTSVDYFDGNGLIAIANNGYFYQSLDTGLTWTPYPQPVSTITSISLYPDHKRAYICDGSHLYQTTDAAVSWQEIKYTGITASYLGLSIDYIYIKNEDTLLAGVNDRINGAKIYLSPDKGKTWTLVGENLEGDSPLGSAINDFYFVNPSQGYALGNGFYAETVNGGHSWTLSVIDFNIAFVSILEIPKHPTIISIAIPQSDQLPPFDSTVFFKGGIQKIVQAGSMLYGVYGHNFFSSADSGKTWTIKSIDANKNFKSIAFVDQQTGIIVGEELTTYRTNDGGTTWTKYVYGGAEGFNKIYCKTKDECYITGNAGRLFHTTNGGTSWDFRDLYNGALQNVIFPTNDTGYISASGSIFRTIDAGTNWIRFKQTTGGAFIYFPTKDTGFIGYAGGSSPDIAKSTDAGKTWNTWLADMTFVTYKTGGGGACFRSTKEGLVGGDNSLLYTNDGGNSWQNKAVGITGNEISATNDKGWVILSIYDSTVNSLQQGFVRMFKCDKDINCKETITTANGGGLKKVNDSTLCFQSGDSIYFSKDYGNTWKSQLYWNGYQDLCFSTTKIAYSIGIGSIYKAWFASNLAITNIKENNKTVSITLSFTDGVSSINTTMYLLNNVGDTVYSVNKVIENGLLFSITLPNTIADGTYSIVIMPNDTLLYNKAQSQPFSIITTSVDIIDKDKKPVITVVGDIIGCNCQTPFEIYNIVGQRMQNNTELPIGIYIVKCNNIIQKVIIRP